jgi:hypothetical protein
MLGKEWYSGTLVQGYKIVRSRHMLTELVDSQERCYVIEAKNLYDQSGQGSSVREVVLNGNVMR